MKKVLFITTAIIFLFSTLDAVAAEYVAKRGECLGVIAENTRHTVTQLALMNYIANPDFIRTGQKIVFISNENKKKARAWAEKRLQELDPASSAYKCFFQTIENLDKNKIAYVADESGAYYEEILIFAGDHKRLW